MIMVKRSRDKKHGLFRILIHVFAPVFSLLKFIFKIVVFGVFTIDIEKDDRDTIKIMLFIYGAITFIAIALILLIMSL